MSRKYSCNSKKVSLKNNSVRLRAKRANIRIKRKPVSLFIVPYITALFLFSISINLIDSFWQVKTPAFSVNDLILHNERELNNTFGNTLKASVGTFSIDGSAEGVRERNNGILYISSYTVREEDRYTIIAEKFNISLESLISVNNIESSSAPEPGTILKIPNISGIYYTVNKGDTLTSISTLYNLDIEELRMVNNLYSTVIHIGDKLFIPGTGMEKNEVKRILNNKFSIPAAGTVKNNYGSYIDPVTGLKNYNYGIDIINSKGTAVYAARDGVVKNISYNPYYGKVVLINHSGSFQSMYGCLDSIVVEPAQTVLRGELLGYIGSSGFKSGNHLQFSIFKNKEDVDTLDFIF